MSGRGGLVWKEGGIKLKFLTNRRIRSRAAYKEEDRKGSQEDSEFKRGHSDSVIREG